MKKIFSLLAVLVLISLSSCGDDSGSSSSNGWWTEIDWETADNGSYASFTYDGLSPSCSNAPETISDFTFFYKSGTSNNLLIYFQGGGACWHNNNCFVEPTFSAELSAIEDPYYLDLIGNQDPLAVALGYGGIFDFTHSANRFREWHMVYIPYCTGDLHWGAEDNSYSGGTIRHRGHVNFRVVLQWMKNNFTSNPERIFVTGISAGSYGAIFNFPYIKEEFSLSDFFMLGDAGNGVLNEDFKTSGLPNWDMQVPDSTRLPGSGFTDLDGLDITTLEIYDLYSKVANHYTDARFGQYTTAWDETQAYFYNVMENIASPGTNGANWLDIISGNTWCDWNKGMRDNLSATTSALSGGTYHSFVAPGEDHTVLMSNFYFSEESSGVTLLSWIDGMLDGTAAFTDVTCTGDTGCAKPDTCSCMTE
jgi:hypothetical protein